jgi:hypothetical protein
MKKIIFYSGLQLLLLVATSQPYVDPLQIRYTYAFRSQNNNRGTPYTHLWVGSDIPIEIKNKTYLLLSPFYENWQLDSASVKNILPVTHGLVLPAGMLIPLKNKSWMLSVMAIARTNGEKLFAEKTFQFGGISFLSYERSPGKKIRFGAYANSDFFGLFVIPLIGADWRMDEKNYFFGLLPGRFTWEHQFKTSLYGGVTFRAITNSYRLQNGQYLRIDDNQLSTFLDFYPAKKICVTLEPGYGILRKLRTGINKRDYITDEKWGDGLFIKLSAAYRIRLPNIK